MPTTPDPRPDEAIRPAPTEWGGVLRQLGPGLIISAVIVGSGELIVTPKLGAAVGFQLLWFIILGCFIKVFVQIELARLAITHRLTTLEALNSVPGPRWIVSWLVWLWLLMYVALVFQVAGMVGGLASVFQLAGFALPNWLLTVGVAASCAVLLVIGRYTLVEKVSTFLVALFVVATLVAVGALQTTAYAISWSQLSEGLTFRLPEKFTIAFAAFGIIGVGASELMYYPYWCLEKGYGRSIGENDHSAAWVDRARGWLRILRIDAWVSFAIYTTTTLAFYLLGAAILHAKGLDVEGRNMINTLSHMFRETFGQWSFWLFLVGSFAVLYSTVFGATASNARLFADALSVYGLRRYQSAEDRMRWVKIGCVALPVAFATVYLIFGDPVSLVFVGALAQGVMLPFLGMAALYFHYRRIDPALKSRRAGVVCLWVSVISMTIAGGYKVIEEISKLLK